MRNIEDFLAELSDLGVKLSVESSNLRCHAPKGSLTDILRSELSERKKEIIQFLQQISIDTSERDFIPIIERSGNLPLSFAQERLWLLEQLEQGNATYNMSGFIRLQGLLNLPALEQSIRTIVKRHEVLRTNFQDINGIPVQVIEPDVNITVTVVDLKSLSLAEKNPEIKRLIKQESAYSFNLEKDTLLRVTLLELEEDSYILLLTMHHIISDGWSIGIFINELSTLYKNFCLGQPSPLSELTLQYVDFAHWQRQWLTGETLERQLQYWRQQLQGIPPKLDLPTDREHPPVQTFRGSQESFKLSPTLTEKLQQLSQQTGTTLFMILLAAFAVLLLRYSGQSDVVIGSPIANRNRKEIEGLIGFFVNTLVLRLNLANNPSFYDLLQQTKQITLDAYAHQDLPFEKLVAELQPERSLSYSPLFQVMFILQNTPMNQLELPELTLSSIEVESEIAKFDLTLSMEETTTGLVGEWEYNTDLFEQETILRMTGHFQTLLVGIVTNPQEKIGQLPILTEVEKQQILVDWNNTKADYPQDKCIHQLFEEQVEKTPDAIAVVFEEQELTYRELNNRANQLAHYLQNLGVGPDKLVGLYVERSLEMVIGLFGILKAGGAYVPLDPSYPEERLNYMLEDSQMLCLLVSESTMRNRFEGKVRTINLGKDWGEITEQRKDNLNSTVTRNHLAYVIYTSGSTGKPKGVAVEHRNTVAFICWAQKVFSKDELTGVLASTSICFDLSVFEIFVTLSYGGKVILAENALHLPSLPSAEEITLINTVPSAINQLIEDKNIPKNILTVNLAGEALKNQLVQRIYQETTVKQVYNLYGPSEDTTYSTFTVVPRGAIVKTYIGRPISNTQVYILDANLQPVPIGVTGELYIGGDGLARGYLNRPDLTAEKFIPNPLDKLNIQIKPSKLYKTGDLARYLADGQIDYLGRIDHQVKIRGFRIELEEIETVLRQHPDVQNVIVIDREDSKGEKYLVAYLVSHLMLERLPYQTDCQIELEETTLKIQTEDISAEGIGLIDISNRLNIDQPIRLSLCLPGEDQARWFKGKVVWRKREQIGIKLNLNSLEKTVLANSYHYLLEKGGFLKIRQRSLTTSLRQYLKTKLPDYMIPSVFVLLEALPLTPNGKIDRRALPAPDFSRLQSAEKFVAPRTNTEESLAQIWAEVLKLDRVGIYDNFFELGGHSLLATQVISRIRTTFQIDLSLRSLFEHSNIAELANLVISRELEQVESDTLEEILTEVNELSDEQIKQLLTE